LYIISSFAVVAKSNSLLLGSSLSALDRENFSQIIKRGRVQF
jgi:hypothetical protein